MTFKTVSTALAVLSLFQQRGHFLQRSLASRQARIKLRTTAIVPLGFRNRRDAGSSAGLRIRVFFQADPEILLGLFEQQTLLFILPGEKEAALLAIAQALLTADRLLIRGQRHLDAEQRTAAQQQSRRKNSGAKVCQTHHQRGSHSLPPLQ